MSIVHVILDLDGCACVSATIIECGPPSFERSNFFLSTCTFSQSRLMAAANEESRRREESPFVGIEGSIVLNMMCSSQRLAAWCLRDVKAGKYQKCRGEQTAG